MKTLVSLTCLWLIIQTSFAQMHNIQTRNHVSIDLGSTPTKSPQTSITIKSAIHSQLIYSLQFKSIDSYYFVSNKQHLIKPQIEFYYHPTFYKITFLFGLGSTLNFTPKNRSNSEFKDYNVVEPFISSTIIGSIKCFRYQLPVQLYASDKNAGIRIYPEIAFRYSEFNAIYLRSELMINNFSILDNSKLYQITSIGFQKLF
jgi:hypothetical protein